MTDEIERYKAFAAEYEKITGEPAEPILRKIAALEAKAADPWREAKTMIEGWRKDILSGRHISPAGENAVYLFDHLTAENARLTKRVEELERHVATLVQAGNLYRQASFQSHSGHWDSTMQHGKGCPECIRANDLRKQADEMMDQEEYLEPTESVEPVLDPDRVLATAIDMLKRMFPWRAFTSPAQEAIDFMCRHADGSAKPYNLKGAGNDT